MQKVLVLGCPGAGKSTFSRKLGERTGLPVYHMDSIYWKPGWVESSLKELEENLAEVLRNDRFIIDGNYSNTMQQRLIVADTVFYLDFKRSLCLYRAIKRRIMYQGKTRPDMKEGCPEKIDIEFLKWIWKYPERSRDETLEALEAVKQEKKVYIFKNPSELQLYLEQYVVAE